MNNKLKVLLVLAPFIFSACSTTKTKTEPKANLTGTVDEDNPPSITKAKVKSFIVPDTIEGNKYIKSHRVFILEDAGSWSKD